MKKVAVALSGGVDSATALFLLKQQGYEVVAVFTDYFGCAESSRESSCCAPGALSRARATAAFLDVPFYTLDLRKEFKEEVADPFADAYSRGITPNPCVVCNSRLRFSLLPEKLKAMGIEVLATGHYAALKGTRLFRGADKKKDQSYFLYRVRRENFKKIIFPLAGMLKQEVRRMARRESLPSSEEAESQDSCILSGRTLQGYLKDKVKLRKGEITDKEGALLGEHCGYQNYTIGQGIGLGGMAKRLYVYRVVPDLNRVVAAERKDICRDSVEFRYEEELFFADEGMRVEAKLRSTQEPADAVLEKVESERKICKLRFREPVWAPAPGQSAVLYRDDEVLGGGVIQPPFDAR